VVGQEQVRAAADADPRLRVDAASRQRVQLLEELERVQHHAVAEQAAAPRVQDPRGDLVQDELLLAHVHGVAGVRAALVARDDVDALREHVDDLPLPLVAPLGAHDHGAAMVHLDGVRLSLDAARPRTAAAEPMKNAAPTEIGTATDVSCGGR
jgi:hypothetical protein